MTSTQCAGAAAWSTLGLFDCGCYHSVAAGSHAGHAMLWLAVANLPGPCALPPAAIYTRCMRALPSRCRHGVVLTGSDTAKSFNILLGQHCRGKMLGCRAASCWRSQHCQCSRTPRSYMLYAMTSTQCAGAAGSHAGHAMLSLAVANLPGPCALPPAAIYTRCMRALLS